MKGDFSRNTFDPRKHFSRVLMQQGRVQLDADWNEQAAILLHYLQTLAADLTGPHAGPVGNLGFAITVVEQNLEIGAGHYYVDGILCENESKLSYLDQKGYPFPDSTRVDQLENGQRYLIYLDVWDRHVTCVEDDSIREVALGGPDTATRAQVVWQVKVKENVTDCPDEQTWQSFVDEWQPSKRGLLKAKAKEDSEKETDPCITPPEARYRGAENQLYRVEIHRGGEAWNGEVDKKRQPIGNANDAATFKWSRDNGSVVFPIRTLAGDTATLAHLGHDDRLGLKVGDWVEVVDDEYVLRGLPGPLVQVDTINWPEIRVTLKLPTDMNLKDYKEDDPRHPLLRRWDHKEGNHAESAPQMASDGALFVQKGEWFTLEEGIQIYFEPAPNEGSTNQKGHKYRTGDYWLIPARTATGDVEWPKDSKDDPIAMPPHGVEHHYAPLAILSTDGDDPVKDCRYQFEQIGKPIQQQDGEQ